MRLDIVGGGYGSAHSAFGEGNQLAARAHQHLLSALAGTAGMAGDDTTSQAFAAAYDAGAAEAFGSLADVVGSFEGLGRLTHATSSHHAWADARSVVGGTPVYEGGWLPEVGPDTGYVSVLPATPPSALGSNQHDYGRMVGWVLDHVQGFVWPNADTARLRAAARAWHHAAEQVADLVVACNCAVRGLWRERSPEVPVAIEATHELRQTVSFISDQYAALGAACETYADQVDAKRHEVVELAESLLEQCVKVKLPLEGDPPAVIDQKLVATLLDDVEETLDAEGVVALHDFGWTLRGLRPDLGRDAWLTTCQEAYRLLRDRHPLELGWTTWQDFGSGGPVTTARDDTALDFDLDPDVPVDTPLLVLVPAGDDTRAR